MFFSFLSSAVCLCLHVYCIVFKAAFFFSSTISFHTWLLWNRELFNVFTWASVHTDSKIVNAAFFHVFFRTFQFIPFFFHYALIIVMNKLWTYWNAIKSMENWKNIDRLALFFSFVIHSYSLLMACQNTQLHLHKSILDSIWNCLRWCSIPKKMGKAQFLVDQDLIDITFHLKMTSWQCNESTIYNWEFIENMMFHELFVFIFSFLVL